MVNGLLALFRNAVIACLRTTSASYEMAMSKDLPRYHTKPRAAHNDQILRSDLRQDAPRGAQNCPVREPAMSGRRIAGIVHINGLRAAAANGRHHQAIAL